jgi:hypothetical protein
MLRIYTGSVSDKEQSLSGCPYRVYDSLCVVFCGQLLDQLLLLWKHGQHFRRRKRRQRSDGPSSSMPSCGSSTSPSCGYLNAFRSRVVSILNDFGCAGSVESSDSKSMLSSPRRQRGSYVATTSMIFLVELIISKSRLGQKNSFEFNWQSLRSTDIKARE